MLEEVETPLLLSSTKACRQLAIVKEGLLFRAKIKEGLLFRAKTDLEFKE